MQSTYNIHSSLATLVEITNKVGDALLKSSVQLMPSKRVTGGMGVNDIDAMYDYIFLIDVIMGSIGTW